jgi:hypothetical protein
MTTSRNHLRVIVATAVALMSLGASLPAAAQAVKLIAEPTYGGWTPTTPFTDGRDFAAAAALPDGSVLLAGGKDDNSVPLQSAAIFDPLTAEWQTAAELEVPRAFAAAAALPDGEILVAGGHNNATGYLSSAEQYDSLTDSWAPAPAMLQAREAPIAAVLPDGEVLVAGGEDSEHQYLATAETYNATTGIWTAVAPMREPRERAVAEPLPDGDVLVAGGENNDGPLATAEVYDPTTNSWSAVAPMGYTREGAASAVLSNGDVLVTGGEGESEEGEPGESILAAAETYDPATNEWSEVAPMEVAREGAVAATLPSGAALVMGGFDGTEALDSAELFYSPPQASVAGGEFGRRPLGVTTEDEVLVVTNVGAQSLSIHSVTLGGADPGDFAVVADGCGARTLADGQTCTITTTFTPSAAGLRQASLTLDTNGPYSSETALKGTGVATSTPPPAGPTGSIGPTGSKGSTGAQGPAGEVELITCTLTTTGSGKNAKISQDCSTKHGPQAIHFTGNGQKVAAVISRGRLIYAEGYTFATRSRRGVAALVTALRPIGRGSYTLSIKASNKVQRQTITFR